jgi:hypothetical protein
MVGVSPPTKIYISILSCPPKIDLQFAYLGFPWWTTIDKEKRLFICVLNTSHKFPLIAIAAFFTA